MSFRALWFRVIEPLMGLITWIVGGVALVVFGLAMAKYFMES